MPDRCWVRAGRTTEGSPWTVVVCEAIGETVGQSVAVGSALRDVSRGVAGEHWAEMSEPYRSRRGSRSPLCRCWRRRWSWGRLCRLGRNRIGRLQDM
jgi:hypothetical protein